MAYNFIPYDENQLFLLPPSIAEWVKEDSLARFVSEVVNQLDSTGKLNMFYAGYNEDGCGSAAYHPLMLIKVLVYAYCVGTTSSRRIANAVIENISLRYLAANQRPDFRTISDFRKNKIEQLDGIFVEILKLCKEAGLVKMGRVALDGRKVAGNAALDQNRTKDGIEAEVKKILKEAERVDEEEDKKYGKDKRGDELPDGLQKSEDRLKRLQAAQKRLEEKEQKEKEEQEKKVQKREIKEQEKAAKGEKLRGRKPKNDEKEKEPKANMTDPESRIMKTRQGYLQGFNGQAMADCNSQVIVAQDVTQEENDVKQVSPMLEQCKRQADELPEELLADAGYWSEDNAELEDDNTTLFIAVKKDWKQRKDFKETGAPSGRIAANASSKEKMERRLLTNYGRAAYKQRGSTIEPVFGQMAMRGLTRFLLRGTKKVKAEWSLWCATHNLLKLWRSGYKPVAVSG